MRLTFLNIPPKIERPKALVNTGIFGHFAETTLSKYLDRRAIISSEVLNMEERKSLRGRPRLSEPSKPKVVKFSMSLPPELYARLEAYCEADEREKSYAIRKALEPWLTERGF